VSEAAGSRGLHESPAEEQARIRAATAMRDLGHAFVGRHMTVEQVDRLSEALESISAELWPGMPRRKAGPEGWPASDDEMPQGRIDQRFSDRPMSGAASPWGLDLDVHRHGDEIEARLRFGAAHEGAPGRCHGGIVASLFDDVCGHVLGILRQPAFTGELTVRYLAPTPLHRELACRARLADRRGRKLFVTGELVDVDSGEVLVTAETLFIAVKVEHFLGTAERPAPPPDEAVRSAR
jgi:acyl-coenzyme A thioesterase PaaI-like protein